MDSRYQWHKAPARICRVQNNMYLTEVGEPHRALCGAEPCRM